MPLTDLLTTVSSRTYPRWGQRSVSPEKNGHRRHAIDMCRLYHNGFNKEKGQNDSDIVGIWTCPTCRTLTVLVQQLLDRSSVLESMLVRLEESNRQLVALVGEQRKEMSELRDGMKSANACSYADVVRAPRA